MKTVGSVEGWHDCLSYSAEDFNALDQTYELSMIRSQTSVAEFTKSVENKQERDYRFTLTPSTGILSATECLPLDVDLLITLERSKPSMCAIRGVPAKEDGVHDVTGTTIEGVMAPTISQQVYKDWVDSTGGETDSEKKKLPKLEIKDAYLLVDFVSSPKLIEAHSSINTKPFTFNYENVNVLTVPITTDSDNIRFDNLIGGNTPTHIFAALIKSSALVGNIEDSATQFKKYGVIEFDFTLNGASVTGYPLKSEKKTDWVPVYRRFNEVCNRMHNTGVVSTFPPDIFNKCCWLWSHSFEGEPISTGWIGINFRLEDKLEGDNACDLVVWTVYPSQLTIDKDKKIKKIIL